MCFICILLYPFLRHILPRFVIFILYLIRLFDFLLHLTNKLQFVLFIIKINYTEQIIQVLQ